MHFVKLLWALHNLEVYYVKYPWYHLVFIDLGEEMQNRNI